MIYPKPYSIYLRETTVFYIQNRLLFGSTTQKNTPHMDHCSGLCQRGGSLYWVEELKSYYSGETISIIVYTHHGNLV